jgi:HK97 family phage prohead protease
VPQAFAAAIPSAMAAGLPVLYHHQKTEAPIGFVKTCEERPGGLWGSVILPKPAIGTKAFDLYEAVKSHLLNFFSVGGLWSRTTVGGKVKLGCKRLLEVSLSSVPSNVHAQARGVTAVHGVKAIGGVWVPDFQSRWNAAVHEHRLRDLERDLSMAELQVGVAELLA